MGAHRLYSYRLKLDELAAMRREAEATQKHLEAARKFVAGNDHISEYTAIIKQSWGLTKWLKTKLTEKTEKASIAATDEAVEARSQATTVPQL